MPTYRGAGILFTAPQAPRFVECCEALLDIDARSATAILGFPDDLKLCSSATLFAAVSPLDSVFSRIIAKYFNSRPDPKTLSRIQAGKATGLDPLPTDHFQQRLSRTIGGHQR